MLREIEIDKAHKSSLSIFGLIIDGGAVIVSCHIEWFIPLRCRMFRVSRAPVLQRNITSLIQLSPTLEMYILYDVAPETVYTELFNPRGNPSYHIFCRSQATILAQTACRRVYPLVIILTFCFPFTFQEVWNAYLIDTLLLEVWHTEHSSFQRIALIPVLTWHTHPTGVIPSAPVLAVGEELVVTPCAYMLCSFSLCEINIGEAILYSIK